MHKQVKILNNDVFFAEVERLLKADKQVKIPVKGGSMEPFLKTGDEVLLVPYNKNKVKLRDIVLGVYKGKHMLHRVHAISHEGIRMMGDGNIQQIEDVVHDKVIGIVVGASRDGRDLNINSKTFYILATIWFKFRFLRRIFSIFKRF